VNELAAIRSTIRSAATTTVTSSSTGSGAGLADSTIGRETTGRAGVSQETTALLLTVVKGISITVVSSIPAGAFKESKSHFRYWLIIDEAGGHDFGTELSSFEVGTSGGRGTRVLHIGTLESRASEVGSELRSEGFSDEDLAGTAAESSRGNRGTVEVSVQAGSETESVSDFVDHAAHILFMKKDVRGFSEVASVDSSKSNERSLGSTGHETSHGVGNPTERAGVFTLNDQEEIGSDTALELRGSRITADAS
jgi:hypothetical protein